MPTFLDKTARPSSLRADINVTPLVDVVLVLLIIFMLVAPMLTRGEAVQLPAATSSDVNRPGGSSADLVITVTADKRLWLETHAIQPAALIEELRKRRGDGAVPSLLIRADASVAVGDLRPVLRELRLAGISDVALAVLDAHESAR